MAKPRAPRGDGRRLTREERRDLALRVGPAVTRRDKRRILWGEDRASMLAEGRAEHARVRNPRPRRQVDPEGTQSVAAGEPGQSSLAVPAGALAGAVGLVDGGEVTEGQAAAGVSVGEQRKLSAYKAIATRLGRHTDRGA